MSSSLEETVRSLSSSIVTESRLLSCIALSIEGPMAVDCSCSRAFETEEELLALGEFRSASFQSAGASTGAEVVAVSDTKFVAGTTRKLGLEGAG